MLSIRLAENREWWVSGKTFDRLFQAGLVSGAIFPELESWWRVANANGGLDLSLLKPFEANELKRALLEAARLEISRTSTAATDSDDGSYRLSLSKLLELK